MLLMHTKSFSTYHELPRSRSTAFEMEVKHEDHAASMHIISEAMLHSVVK